MPSPSEAQRKQEECDCVASELKTQEDDSVDGAADLSVPDPAVEDAIASIKKHSKA